MFCIECGTKLSDGSKFCHNCGAKVVTPTAPAQVPKPDPKKSPEELYLLALCYGEGYGREKDEKMAFQLYKSAAEQGCREAMYRLAFCYWRGIGTMIDRDEEDYWDKKMDATKPTDTVASYAMLEKNTELICEVAHGYMTGLSGYKLDVEKACSLYRRAIELGSTYAMRHIADTKMISDEEAFSLCKRAAELGDVSGMKTLSYWYEHGTHTEVNKEMAKYWMEKARRS